MSVFIRPTLRKTGPAQVFQTKWVNGAQISQWVEDDRKAIIPNGTPGRVGEIVDIMRKGPDLINHVSNTPWSPPSDPEFYANKMVPEKDREAYLAKCKEWYDAHPPKKIIQPPPPLPEYNREMIIKFWQGKIHMPPLEERIKVFRAAGMPDKLIEKHKKWDQKMIDTSDERQKKIDNLFGKYAKTKTKTASKLKPKVLKPVKKKMT
jgi:hypothetical protein